MEAAAENQNWKRNENETAPAMKIHVKLEKVVSVPNLVFFPIQLPFF